jgi:hypothetical protein
LANGLLKIGVEHVRGPLGGHSNAFHGSAKGNEKTSNQEAGSDSPIFEHFGYVARQQAAECLDTVSLTKRSNEQHDEISKFVSTRRP